MLFWKDIYLHSYRSTYLSPYLSTQYSIYFYMCKCSNSLQVIAINLPRASLDEGTTLLRDQPASLA